MVEGAHLWYNQIPYPPGGWPTNWKITISQGFSYRNESAEPHIRLPSLGVWHWEGEPPVPLALKARRAWLKELSPWRVHTSSCVHRDPGEKQWLHRSLGQTDLLVFEGPLGRQGLVAAHCGDNNTGGGGTREYSLTWALLEMAILTPRWPHSTACRLQCWDASGQTTNRAGTQPHPSADRLPKVFLSPQPPLNTSLDMALPTRGTRPSSTHQWAGTSPSYQEVCTSLLDQPKPPGGRQQKQEELQSCSLWNGDHKHRKLDKMRQQRNMLQTKEQDKSQKNNN